MISWVSIVLLVLSGICLSVSTGLFKDWLKKVIPNQVAIIGFVFFLVGAIISLIVNHNKISQKEKIEEGFDQTAQQNNKLYDAYLRRGKDYYYNGELDSAITYFTKSIEVLGNIAEPYYWRALTYAQKKDYIIAINNFNEAIDREKRIAEYYYYRGNCYFDLKEYSKALADYSSALNIKANSEFYFQRGFAYQSLSKLENAFNDYTMAINLDTMNARAYVFKGAIFFDKVPSLKNVQIFIGIDSTALNLVDSAIVNYTKGIIYSRKVTLTHLLRARALIERMRIIQIGDLLYNKCKDEIDRSYYATTLDIAELFKSNENKAKPYFYRAYSLMLKAGSDKTDSTKRKIPDQEIYLKAKADLDSSIAIDDSYAKAFYLRSRINKYLGYSANAKKDSILAVVKGYEYGLNDKFDKLIMLNPKF